jgi:hypothetical protein
LLLIFLFDLVLTRSNMNHFFLFFAVEYYI